MGAQVEQGNASRMGQYSALGQTLPATTTAVTMAAASNTTFATQMNPQSPQDGESLFADSGYQSPTLRDSVGSIRRTSGAPRGSALGSHSGMPSSAFRLPPVDFGLLDAFHYGNVPNASHDISSEAFDFDFAFDANGSGEGTNDEMLHGDLVEPTYSPPPNNTLQLDSVLGHGSQRPIDDFMNFDVDSTVTRTLRETPPKDLNTRSTSESDVLENEFRKDCLQKLAELHASLMRDLDLIKACKPANECGGSGMASRGPNEGTNEDKEKSDYPIGRVLKSSEKFLEILQYFARPPSRQPSSRPSRGPSDSASSRVEQHHPAFGRPSDHTSSALNHASSTFSGSAMHRPLSRPEFSTAVNGPEGTLQCDVPTTLSILTCYVCLTRIFRTIFSCIHVSLRTIAPTSQNNLPPLFPGLQLGGFQLESHLNLQIQILVQVSDNMLSRIDSALGLPGERGCMAGGILEQTASTTLLQMMMKEEAIEKPDDAGGGVKSLREVMASVKQLC